MSSDAVDSLETWFYEERGERKGPVSEATLIELIAVRAVTYGNAVWRKGMADWVKLEQSDLRSYVEASGPPPFKSEPGSLQVDISFDAFKSAVVTCFKKYAAFDGRARRSELWYFSFFSFLLLTPLVLIAPILYLLIVLGLFLPSLGVQIRRLHDIDRSGWWLLVSFIPLVGYILLIVWFCGKGTAGTNRFGPDPLA